MKFMVGKYSGKWVLAAAALLLAAAFTACGGGGGSVADGGIGGTGRSVGAISGFGSVIVNGVEFETSGATVVLDDTVHPDDSGLRLGMVVEIEGTFNDDGVTGTAATVSFDDLLEGPVVSSVNTTTQSFQVMGQVVFFSAATVFEDTGVLGGDRILPGDLAVGHVVEVSGQFDSAGQVRATRVERKALSYTEGNVIEVKGIVANLDTNSFTLNALTINYSAVATSFDNGTIGGLADDVLVEVKGDDDPSDGLFADRIEFEQEDFGSHGDLLQYEGVVTDTNPAVGDFEVNGLPVVTGAQTQWRGGYSGPGDVTLDDRVEVDGQLQDQAGTLVLVAREVELEVEEDVRIEAFVQSIQASTNVLTALGIEFSYSDTTAITEFEDRDGAISASDDLAEDDWVLVRAYIDSSGAVRAVRIEKDNADADPARIILRGPAADVPPSPGAFSIMGVTINLGASVDYYIENSPSDQASFFNALKNGRVVKARGTYNGTDTLTVNELDLQN